MKFRDRGLVNGAERCSGSPGDLSPVALVGSGLDGVITSWNRAATALLGWSAEAVIGKSLVDVLGCDARPRAVGHSGVSRFRTRVDSARGVALDVDLLVDGESYPVDPRGEYVVALVPVAAIAPAAEAGTSPPVDNWTHAAKIVRDIGGTVQCVAVGLVGVEAVNRGYSRSTGDAVLREITRRLECAVGNSGRVVRIGGNQFVAVTPVDAPLDAAQLVAQISHPVETRLGSIRIGCYVGSIIGDSASGLVVLDRADLAMRRALARGVGAIEFQSDIGHPMSSHHPRLDTLLIDAVARRAISVRFQPVIELCTGRILEFEALARWHSHELGDVDPNAFIGAAEVSGLIHDLGQIVLEKSLDVVQAENLAGRWCARRMSVNLSAVQLAHPDLSTRVLEALTSRGLDGDVLQLELTDTRPIADLRVATQQLGTLRRAGVRVALDDFGTGCTNMSYLRDLPVEVLKIDRRFIAGMCASSVDTAVIRSIIALATELQLDVIAEGVEDEDQHRALCRMGCFAAQGLLYASGRDQDDLYAAVGPPPRALGRRRSVPSR